jgi:putative tryptophan/tyrosine transport system substrate-binding protein
VASSVPPLPAHAQQRATPLIGFLGAESADLWTNRVVAFRQGLTDAGYVEGRNVEVEYRWAEGYNERLHALAAELVERRVDVLVVLGGTASALAAKAATTTIPIVFRLAVDPVEAGLVNSLNRPGGNLTGVTTMGADLGSKQLELLHEVVPAATVMALLTNPTNPSIAQVQARDVPAAAMKLGLRLHVVNASAEPDFDPIFAKLKELGVGGLVIGADTFLNARSDQVAALAVRHAIPTVSPYRQFTRAGGLMSYGANITAASQQVGVYTARVLKGEKAADLPVVQPTVFELSINVKSAKALGLAVPATLLALADEVIE